MHSTFPWQSLHLQSRTLCWMPQSRGELQERSNQTNAVLVLSSWVKKWNCEEKGQERERVRESESESEWEWVRVSVLTSKDCFQRRGSSGQHIHASCLDARPWLPWKVQIYVYIDWNYSAGANVPLSSTLFHSPIFSAELNSPAFGCIRHQFLHGEAELSKSCINSQLFTTVIMSSSKFFTAWKPGPSIQICIKISITQSPRTCDTRRGHLVHIGV